MTLTDRQVRFLKSIVDHALSAGAVDYHWAGQFAGFTDAEADDLASLLARAGLLWLFDQAGGAIVLPAGRELIREVNLSTPSHPISREEQFLIAAADAPVPTHLGFEQGFDWREISGFSENEKIQWLTGWLDDGTCSAVSFSGGHAVLSQTGERKAKALGNRQSLLPPRQERKIAAVTDVQPIPSSDEKRMRETLKT